MRNGLVLFFSFKMLLVKKALAFGTNEHGLLSAIAFGCFVASDLRQGDCKEPNIYIQIGQEFSTGFSAGF